MEEDPPAPLLFDAETEQRLLTLMQYSVWTGAVGVALAVIGAVLLYATTSLGTLLTAGCAVGLSIFGMLSLRLVRLRGLGETIWQEWAFILASAGSIVGLTALLEWLLP